MESMIKTNDVDLILGMIADLMPELTKAIALEGEYRLMIRRYIRFQRAFNELRDCRGKSD